MATKNLNSEPELQPPAPRARRVIHKRANEETEALVPAPHPQLEYLNPVMNLTTAMQRLAEFQQFVKSYLVEDEDYGVIPGTKKRTLLKPGADKLCDIYGLADTYPEDRIKRTIDWHSDPPLFDYEVTCVLKTKSSGNVVGEGMGSCSSWEAKYRYRDSQRKCPACGKDAIIKGKEEYGGGWLCFRKKGGCGMKFGDKDPQMTDQIIGRIANPDIIDQKNTVLKMAKKRAKIDAVIGVTRSSGIFTQDMEDIAAPETNGSDNKMSQTAASVSEKPAPVNVKEQLNQLDQQMTMEQRAAPARTFGDYRKAMENAKNLDELKVAFVAAYRGFARDPEAQEELKKICEQKKAQFETNGSNGHKVKNAPVSWN
jgi:hypothetical protein